MPRAWRIAPVAAFLLLAGCGGGEAAPPDGAAPNGTPVEQAEAQPPQITVETPVRSPGALVEADSPRPGPAPTVARVESPEPESADDPAPAPPQEVPAAEAAPPPPAAGAPAGGTELLAVLPARDLDASVAFYRDALGFTRTPGELGGEVVLERGSERLALRRTDEGVAGRGASGWDVPRSGVVLRLEVDDLAAVRERLTGAGLAPRRARGGGVAVLDPAGHLVVVTGP